MCFRCYDSLKFPLTYNEKSESRSKLLNMIGCHGNQKDKFAKNIQNSAPQNP